METLGTTVLSGLAMLAGVIFYLGVNHQFTSITFMISGYQPRGLRGSLMYAIGMLSSGFFFLSILRLILFEFMSNSN